MRVGNRSGSVRCVRCSATWHLQGLLEEVRCPGCGSWNVVVQPTSPWPMILLLATSALIIYFLIRPEALTRLLGQ